MHNDQLYGGYWREQNPSSEPGLGLIPQQWDPTAELEQLLYADDSHSVHVAYAEPEPPLGFETPLPEPVVDTVASPTVLSPGTRHRKRRRGSLRASRLASLLTVSFFVAALAAVLAAMVSVLSGMVAYAPLRHFANPDAPRQLARWWPLLVYGPWMVASLSILRAALHRRRVAHSWAAVLLFSTFAVALCVAQAPRTLTGAAVAALPPVAALVCFQQLVRQVTLTMPPRQAHPRHRERGKPKAGSR